MKKPLEVIASGLAATSLLLTTGCETPQQNYALGTAYRVGAYNPNLSPNQAGAFGAVGAGLQGFGFLQEFSNSSSQKEAEPDNSLNFANRTAIAMIDVDICRLLVRENRRISTGYFNSPNHDSEDFVSSSEFEVGDSGYVELTTYYLGGPAKIEYQFDDKSWEELLTIRHMREVNPDNLPIKFTKRQWTFNTPGEHTFRVKVTTAEHGERIVREKKIRVYEKDSKDIPDSY